MSDSKSVTGVVKFNNARPFGGKTLYSVKLENDQNLYRIGEKGYGDITTEGNTITITYTEKTVNGKVTQNVTDIVPATPAAPANKSSGGGTTYGGGTGAAWGAEKDLNIQYQAARNTAVEVLRDLVVINGFKLGAKTKVQDNYVAYMAMLDKLTAQFYEDTPVKAAVTRNAEALEAEDPFEHDEDPVYDD
jgi:hypothetical protein